MRTLNECLSAEDAEELRREHRKKSHQTDDQEAFFDCVVCGVIDGRIRRLKRNLQSEHKTVQ